MSFLSYGIIVWGQTFSSLIEPIFILQKRAVRAISHRPRFSNTAPIFRELKLLRISEIFHFKLLTFVYDSVNKTSPPCFHNFFHINSSIHHHFTRQADRGDLFQSHWNTMIYGRNSIKHLGPRMWNDLPSTIRQASTKHSFKKSLKIFLLDYGLRD